MGMFQIHSCYNLLPNMFSFQQQQQSHKTCKNSIKKAIIGNVSDRAHLLDVADKRLQAIFKELKCDDNDSSNREYQ